MKKKAFIYIIIAGILWGTSGIFVKVLSKYGFTSLQLTAVRAIVSFISMSLYTVFRDRKKFRASPADLLIYLGMGLGIFGTASCYFISMQATSISTAVVLMYTAPIYVTVFSVIFFKERFSRLKLISVICMMIGCALVSGIIGGLRFDACGIAVGALSGISYGAYNIISKISARKGCDPLSATLYGFLFMSIVSLAVSKPQEIVTYSMKAPLITVPLLLGIGIVTCVFPYLLYNTAMNHLPAGTASALGIVEPMSATVFSILLFKEKPNIFSVMGIIMILVAVFLLGKAENSKESNGEN